MLTLILGILALQIFLKKLHATHMNLLDPPSPVMNARHYQEIFKNLG